MKIRAPKTKKSQAGFSVIEIIIALGISTIIVSGIIGLLVQSLKYTRWSEHRWQATSLADGAVEAAISIAENDWATLAGYTADGTTVYRLTNAGSDWSFVADPGGEDIGIFNRGVTFDQACRDGDNEIAPCGGSDPVDPDSRKVTATVTWEEENGQTLTVTVEEYLSNWEVCYARWLYTYGSNYTYDTNKVEVTGGMASLINRTAQEIDNGDFQTGDFTDWVVTGDAWEIIDDGGANYVATTQNNPDRIGTIRGATFTSAGQQLRFRHKGFAGSGVITDDDQVEFDAGSYSETQWDGANNWVEMTPAGQASGSGQYYSSVRDAGLASDWDSLSWIPQQPYLKELPNNKGVESGYPSGNASMSDNVLLYHLNEGSGNVADFSGQNNNGNVNGGVGYGADGVYETALDFNGSNGRIEISNTSDINTGGPYTDRTIELWFKADSNSGRHVLYEEGAQARGLNIYTDGSSLYVGGWNRAEYYWAGTWLNTGFTTGNWHHVVLVLTDASGSVQPDKFKGYLDGVEFGSGAGGQLYSHGGDIEIARSGGGSYYHTGQSGADYEYDGIIDEVAIYNRDLAAGEIAARYKRGATRLKYQVRSCDDEGCDTESYIGPDGTSGTFYSELQNGGLGLPSLSLTNVSTNRYFQYQAIFETINSGLSPELKSVTTDGGVGNYVGIYRASNNEWLERIDAPDNIAWQNVIIDLSAYPNQELYLQAVDNYTEPTDGWYAVDDFRQTDDVGNPISGYATDSPDIVPDTPHNITSLTNWYSFAADNSGTGTVYYQLSNDGGTTWYYWNAGGGTWSVAGAHDYSLEEDINDNISTFPAGGSITVQAFLESNGSQPVLLDEVVVAYEGQCGP